MINISGFSDEISYNLDDQINTLRDLNQHFMCPRHINNKNIVDYTCDEFVRDIKPKLDSNGIKFSSIGTPFGKLDIYDDDGYKKQLDQLKEVIKICEVMGCKYIRTFSFFIPQGLDYDHVFSEVVRKVRGFLQIAHGHDVILLHENEKKIYGDTPDRVLKLYNVINNPQYKLCFDASNYIQCKADPLDAYERTKKYTAYYHMKDCKKGIEVPLGMGDGQIQTIIDDLVKNGYDGFLTLEPHTAKYALLKKFVYVLPPIAKLGIAREAYKEIDKQYNKKAFEKVSRREVYEWQHQNLIKILEKAGYEFE